MKIKRLFAAVMAGVLVTGMLAGCSSSGSKDGGSNASQNNQREKTEGGQDEGQGAENAGGRYMEENLDPPVQSGEKPLGAFEKDGVLWMYTSAGDEETGASYYSYRYSDGSWSGPQEETGMEAMDAENQIVFMKMVLGEDGNLYALGTNHSENEPYGSRILMQNDDGSTWTDVTPEKLKEADSSGYAAMLPDLDVLSDGSLCVANMDMTQVEIYREGKKVFSADTASLNSDRQESMNAFGDTLAVVGSDQKSIVFYQGSDFAQVGSFQLEDTLENEGVGLTGGKDGLWYYMDHKGIHRMQSGGSIVETVMDGSYGKMGNAECLVYSFCQGENDDFYGLYRNYGTGELFMCHYYFDENVPAVADSTLTVYGLRESKTVEQAVSYFQSAHPEVKVDYSYSAGEFEEISTDQIRTLNAQILNGEGPDVLILDGMPVSSYVEKGILTDLSDLESQLREQGVLMDTIKNTASGDDGKIYGLPARIGIPIVFGDEEAVDALESLDALENYLKNHPDGKVFSLIFYDSAAKTLFSCMYQELVQDGNLNQENLARLFRCWKQICDNLDTKSLEQFYDYTPGKWFTGQQMYFGSGNDVLKSGRVVTTDLQGIFSMMLPCNEIKNAGVSPQPIQQYYIPYVIAGINASSGNQELAKEFLLAMFSDDVQKSQTDDGFPVTENGLNALVEYVESDAAKDISVGESFVDAETGEENFQNYGYPDGETIKSYIDMIRNLKQPFLPDQVFLETVMEEINNCYEGNQTPEGAAQAAAQKMETYLSE